MARNRTDGLRRLHVVRLPEAGCIAFEDETRKHMAVLRLAPGDEVELFDGRGHVARAQLTASGATILQHRDVDDSPFTLVLAVALPKGANADRIVRMRDGVIVSDQSNHT